MKRFPGIPFAALLLFSPHIALSQGLPPPLGPSPSAPVPQRIIQFVELNFSDPTSWTCNKESTSGQASANCSTCQNTGSDSSDLVVTHPDTCAQSASNTSASGQDTISIPAGSSVELCGNILTVQSAAQASATPGATSTAASPTATPTP